MTWGVGTAGLLVTEEPQHATLHEGGVQGTGHPTGLQPENPGGNVTPAENKEKFWLLIDVNSFSCVMRDYFNQRIILSNAI